MNPSKSLELQAYIKSISAPRELICPITQDLYTDPVLALGDGYTYERQAITTWFQSQLLSSSAGSTMNGAILRSPVTNAYMEASIPLNGSNTSGPLESVPCTTLVENKVIASMTHAFREKLGRELCRRCQRIAKNHHVLLVVPDRPITTPCDLEEGSLPTANSLSSVSDHKDWIIGDEHDQIKALIDSGADLSIQECEDGSTALMLMIRSGYLDISWHMLRNRPKLSITNDQGYSCLDIAKNVVGALDTSSRRSYSLVPSFLRSTSVDDSLQVSSQESLIQRYRDLITELESKMTREKNEIDASFKAKSEANAQHRQRQQVLAAGARSYNATMTQRDARFNMELIQRGLGQLYDHGWGFFPSLAALQFHGSIPEPPASFVEVEKRMQRRLEKIVKTITIIILIVFILL
jgi:hypothetical protein